MRFWSNVRFCTSYVESTYDVSTHIDGTKKMRRLLVFYRSLYFFIYYYYYFYDIFQSYFYVKEVTIFNFPNHQKSLKNTDYGYISSLQYYSFVKTAVKVTLHVIKTTQTTTSQWCLFKLLLPLQCNNHRHLRKVRIAFDGITAFHVAVRCVQPGKVVNNNSV